MRPRFLRLLVRGRRLLRGVVSAIRDLKPLDARLGARSLIGEITRLGALLLIAGLAVNLVVLEIAQRSSADERADFDMIDYALLEARTQTIGCREAPAQQRAECLRVLPELEARAIWRVVVEGDAYRSATMNYLWENEAWLESGECQREGELRIGEFLFYTCRRDDETAYRVAERLSDSTFAALEHSLWQDNVALAQKRQRWLQISVGVLALALVVVLALAFWATRRRLVRHFTRLDQALERYREGDVASIEGEYPSEIQALADSLNRAIEKKTALMDRQRRYVAKMAHDLRHQLVAIDLASRPGEDGAVDEDDLKSELTTLNGLVERYLTLTDWIGPTEGAPPANVFDALDGARKAFSRRLRVDPLEFEVDCPADLKLRAHPADLRIILANLVGNAHRFAASRVRLGARPAAQDATFHEGAAPDEGVEIWVEDDGPGIPADKRADAMAWGGRLDAKRAGTGFGLSIVAEQVSELYGGALRLEDGDLGGLRAVVVLPGRPQR